MTKRITTLMSASALTLAMFAVNPANADFELQFGSNSGEQQREEIRDARQEGREDIREARQESREDIRDARRDPTNTRREQRREVRDAKMDMREDVREAKREQREEVNEATAPRWMREDDDDGITIELN